MATYSVIYALCNEYVGWEIIKIPLCLQAPRYPTIQPWSMIWKTEMLMWHKTSLCLINLENPVPFKKTKTCSNPLHRHHTIRHEAGWQDVHYKRNIQNVIYGTFLSYLLMEYPKVSIYLLNHRVCHFQLHQYLYQPHVVELLWAAHKKQNFSQKSWSKETTSQIKA